MRCLFWLQCRLQVISPFPRERKENNRKEGWASRLRQTANAICTTWPSFPLACRLLSIISTHKWVQSTLYKTDTFGTGSKCPSYRESNKGSKERQGPTLSVRFTEVSVKRESNVFSHNLLSIRIFWAGFYLLIFYFNKFSTWICRLPFAVYVKVKLSNDWLLNVFCGYY